MSRVVTSVIDIRRRAWIVTRLVQIRSGGVVARTSCPIINCMSRSSIRLLVLLVLSLHLSVVGFEVESGSLTMTIGIGVVAVRIPSQIVSTIHVVITCEAVVVRGACIEVAPKVVANMRAVLAEPLRPQAVFVSNTLAVAVVGDR